MVSSLSIYQLLFGAWLIPEESSENDLVPV